MKEENNIVHLSEYIQQNQKVESINKSLINRPESKPRSELNSRMMAFGVDFVAILFTNYLVHGAYTLFVNQFLHPIKSSSKSIILSTDMTVIVAVFLTLFASYFLYAGVVLNGKTLGKYVFKLSVINESFVINHLENTHEMTMMQALQRSAGYLTCYLSFGTFFIFNFASEDQRGLSDYLSGTRTVSDNWLNSMLEHKEFSAEEISIDIRALDKVA